MEKPETLSEGLAERLWELISRELEQAGLDGALVRCRLSGGCREGRPVLNIRFLGRTYSVPDLPPVEETLLVFSGGERRALYAISRKEMTL